MAPRLPGLGLLLAALAVGLPAMTMPHFGESLGDGRVPYGSDFAWRIVAAKGDEGWASPYLVADGLWITGMGAAALAWETWGTPSPSRWERRIAYATLGICIIAALWAVALVMRLHEGGCLFNGNAPWNCPWGN